MIQENDVLRLPGENFYKCGSMAEVERAGFRVFHLGSVYVYGCVKESLPAMFAKEYWEQFKKPVTATTIRFDRPIVTACAENSYILDAIDRELYGRFKTWMLSLNLVDRTDKRFFCVRSFTAPILDPLAFDSRSAKIPASLPIFSVSGPSGRLLPKRQMLLYSQAPEMIELVRSEPDPTVRRDGRAAFSVLGGV